MSRSGKGVSEDIHKRLGILAKNTRERTSTISGRGGKRSISKIFKIYVGNVKVWKGGERGHPQKIGHLSKKYKGTHLNNFSAKIIITTKMCRVGHLSKKRKMRSSRQ